MKVLGDDIYIQRGENWSLDLEITNGKGEPYMLFREWRNPFLVITVTAARYEQRDDFRQSWWLDMNNRWVEQPNGTFSVVPMKRFIETTALYVMYHTIYQALLDYGVGTSSGRITADGDKTKPFDVTNFLFYTEPNADGKRIYKYCKDYTVDSSGAITSQTWEEYSFRIIKQFDTKTWTEQNYLFDMKILAGETVEEYTYNILVQQYEEDIPDLPWADEVTIVQMKRITNKELRQKVQMVFESGQPLMPDYDTKTLVLNPTKLTVSANIQGGLI